MPPRDTRRRFFSSSTSSPHNAVEFQLLQDRGETVDPNHQSDVNTLPKQAQSKLQKKSQSFGKGILRWNSSKTHLQADSRGELSGKPTSTRFEATLAPPTRVPHRSYESRAASAMSLPILNVPERKSSASALRGLSRQSSIPHIPNWRLDGSREPSFVPGRGLSCSPVRKSMEKEAVSSDTLRRLPPKTIVRTVAPLEVLDQPVCRHNRVTLTNDISAPLFSGGGTLEGKAHLEVDEEPSRRPSLDDNLAISRLCVDVIGVEETSDGKRWVFLSLASELIDRDHPPPFSLVITQSPTIQGELYWPIKPSSVDVPFCLNLPLNLGPPPYVSKQARIRYVLAVTAQLHLNGKSRIVRQSKDIQLLTVYDPEKALASLPSPLLASDSVASHRGQRLHSVKLTGGLHRQTWVNGSHIFADVHIVNKTSKTVKRIEVQLEKTTLWYPYTAAGTAEKSANHLRLPKRTDTEVVAATSLKKGRAWKGIAAGASEVRTLALEVPRGHVTITTGRYFEVRYFLNVIAVVSRFKSLVVQLPVTIIHMNSLDIVPNSLAQVAAAIEAKRARCVPESDETSQYPPYHQGQAFTAPRRQSLDQMRNDDDSNILEDRLDPREIDALTSEFDDSPRKSTQRRGVRSSVHGQNQNAPKVKQKDSEARERTLHPENIAPYSLDHAQSCHNRSTRMSPSARNHQRNKSSGSSMAATHPKIPRLQLSTSGLGFTESEFSFEKESPPRKVMLSESERHTLHQQRELRLARERSIQSQSRQHAGTAANAQSTSQHPVSVHRRPSKVRSGRNEHEAYRFTAPPDHWEWRNVAVSGRPASSSPWYGYDGSSARMMPERFKRVPEWDRPVSLSYGHGQSVEKPSRRVRSAYGKYPKMKASFE